MQINFCRPTQEGFATTERFELAFAEAVGAKYAVAVNSGYSALFLSLWALGIRSGDEVIVPDFTMIATAHAVTACGAKPVFVDVEGDTGNISAENIKNAITPNTKAVVPVHIYGHPCDMDSILAVARAHGLKVIQDAAEAHGALYKGQKIGSLGDAACYSFYGNKIVSTGEGGAVTTDNEDLAKELRSLRSYHFSKNYLHTDMGWSFRINPLGAVAGLHSLWHLDDTVAKKREIAAFYNDNLKHSVSKPVEKEYARSVYWMYGIGVSNRDEIMKKLADDGIETRAFFRPMREQPMYAGEMPGVFAKTLHNTGILLPSMPTLTKDELQYVCDRVNEHCA